MNIVPRISDRQYIMRAAKLRSFIDFIIVSAKTADARGYFEVTLKEGLWNKRDELMSKFF